MSLSLGEKLRQAREERGISISEVAEQTRISPLYLSSIENDDYKTLPGGIFNKGFVKSYAKYIGFDEQEALQEYARIIAETEGRDEADLKVYKPEVLTDDRTASSMAPTIIFAVIILALMTGGILFVVNYIQNPETQPAANSNSTAPANANTETAANTGAIGAPPQTDGISVSLKAVGEPVWMSYTLDGKTTEQTLGAEESVSLNASDSLKIKYSKSRLPNLQIVLNGKRITPPDTGAKGNVEIDINRSNVAQLMQGGEVSATPPQTSTEPAATVTPPAASPSPAGATRPRPETPATPKPVQPKPATNRAPAGNATQTPIVIGRPANSATRP